MIIPIYAENEFDEMQYPFTTKMCSFLNLINEHLQKNLQLTSHIRFRETESFPPKIQNKARMPSHHFYSTLHWKS